MRNIGALLILLAIVCPARPEASTGAEVVAAWTKALEWSAATQPVPLPEGGLKIPLDAGHLEIIEGSLRPMAPILGRSTGFVFEGRAHFVMEVPDPVELAQLRRYIDRPSVNRIETPVKQVVFRSSHPVSGISTDGPFAPSELAKDRHRIWLADNAVDVDARILEALVNEDPLVVTRIALDTSEWGWLTYSSDPLEQEEIQLSKTVPAGTEIWLSLDREGERGEDGRPSSGWRQRFDLDSVDLDIDLTRGGRWGATGYASVRSAHGQFSGNVRVIPQQSGLRAITFFIDPSAEIKSVGTAGGADLSWIRDRIGVRARKLDNDIWAPQFTVFLDTPTVAGEALDMQMSWTMHLPAFAPGLVWYPTLASNRLDPLTARLRFRTIGRQQVRSSGRRTESDEGESHIVEYVVDRPMKMLGFVIGERFMEQKVDASNGVPPVIAWGPPQGLGARGEIRNVAVDVHNSAMFFGWLLDSPITADEIVISGIPSGHGQSFDGYIQMAEYTFGHDSRGATELFRAHEVAHQWFGHKVGWISDRDQWLSESLAEYAAMMFIQATVEGGDRLFNEIVDTYTNILFGSLRGAAGRFARPGLVELSDRHRGRIGPIGHGVRASTIEMPGGYQLQAYHKGPLVIHMLRRLLGYKHPNDEMFLRILRAYVKEHQDGAPATTATFRNVVEKETQSDWGWFFDQWIDRAAIPSYRWAWSTEPNGSGWKLKVRVTQTGVDEKFLMPVPLRIELDGREPMLAVISVTGTETVREWDFPARPTRVEFNPDRAVLAESRRD